MDNIYISQEKASECEEIQNQNLDSEKDRPQIEVAEAGKKSERKNIFDRIAFFIITAFTFFLPIFVLPIPGIIIDFGKTLFVSIFSLAALFFWLLGRLRGGALLVPRTTLFFSAAAIPLSAFISALSSGLPLRSLVGDGTEMWTFIFTFFLFIIFFLATTLFKRKSEVYFALFLFLVSGAIVLLFQIVHLLFQTKLTSFGFFVHPAHNFIGKWSDFGMFAGLLLIASLALLETLPSKKNIRFLGLFIIVSSLLFLSIASFSFSWLIIGFFSLVIFAYGLSARRKMRKENNVTRSAVPFVPIGVFVIAFAFAVFGSGIDGGWNSKISGLFGLPYIQEARPSWESTFEVAHGTFREGPLRTMLGAGPNNFLSRWLSYRPQETLLTPWWNTDFTVGVGIIPSVLITGGIVGFAGWILFVLFFVYLGIYVLFLKRNYAGVSGHPLLFAVFLAALYVWVISFTDIPNSTVFPFAFLFTGLFIALLSEEKIIKAVPYHFLSGASHKNTRSTMAIAALLLLVGAWAAMSFVVWRESRAVFVYRDVLVALNGGQLDTAEAKMSRVLSLWKTDSYYRAISTTELLRAKEILGKTVSPSSPPDNLRTEFQTFYSSAVAYAQKAMAKDPKSHYNWIQYGGVFSILVPYSVPGISENAYQNAKQAYERAKTFNPRDPSIPLALARLEISRKNYTEAHRLITQSLTMKNNYTDAVFLLAQLEFQSGNTEKAIAASMQAVAMDPENITLLFELGFLKYRAGEWNDAIVALERAVLLHPSYSNARYFLGLSYQKVGRTEDAIKQFTEVRLLNPDNTEVLRILESLRRGEDPFPEADTESSIDDIDKEEMSPLRD